MPLIYCINSIEFNRERGLVDRYSILKLGKHLENIQKIKNKE